MLSTLLISDDDQETFSFRSFLESLLSGRKFTTISSKNDPTSISVCRCKLIRLVGMYAFYRRNDLCRMVPTKPEWGSVK